MSFTTLVTRTTKFPTLSARSHDGLICSDCFLLVLGSPEISSPNFRTTAPAAGAKQKLCITATKYLKNRQMSVNPQIVRIFPNYHLRKLTVTSDLSLDGHAVEFHSQTEKLGLLYVTMCLSWRNSDKELLKLGQVTHWQKLFLKHVFMLSAKPPLKLFLWGNAFLSHVVCFPPNKDFLIFEYIWVILLCKFVNKAQKSAYIVLAGKLFKAVFAYDFFFQKTEMLFKFKLQNLVYRTGRRKQEILICERIC